MTLVSMLYLKDDGDNWSMFNDDMTKVVYEDGSTKPFELSDLQITRGKHAGKNLSEIDDVGYLNWMIKIGGENDDGFIEKCARMRLEELKD